MNGRLAATVTPGNRFEAALERVRLAERLGFESAWLSQLPNARDAAVVLSAYAQATSTIGLGTFILPIFTRHPTLMAQTALTLDEVSGGRFRLGIGVSHKVTVESMWGLSLASPLGAMREYLTIVRSLITTGGVDFQGEHFTARAAYSFPRNEKLPIVVSALSPKMLELAGELADGVALWMCPPAYIRDVVVPHVRAGRERAGKDLGGFDIVAAVPTLLTTDRQAGLDAFRAVAARYASLPYYRKALDVAFGNAMSDNPSDQVLDVLGGIGDEAAVRAIVERYREAGTTLPLIGPEGGFAGWAGFERTLEVVAG